MDNSPVLLIILIAGFMFFIYLLIRFINSYQRRANHTVQYQSPVDMKDHTLVSSRHSKIPMNIQVKGSDHTRYISNQSGNMQLPYPNQISQMPMPYFNTPSNELPYPPNCFPNFPQPTTSMSLLSNNGRYGEPPPNFYRN